jgi:hypothetical protein
MCTKEVETALHGSAHGAAHLDTEMSKDMPCHPFPIESLGATSPQTRYPGVTWASDAMSSQVGGHCASGSLHEHSTGDPL